EPEPHRLQNGVDAEADAPRGELLYCAIEAVEVGRCVENGDDFGAGKTFVPAAGVPDVRAVDAEHQLGPGGECGLHFIGIEAVHRNAEAVGPQRPHGVADAGPSAAGVATEVDDVGATIAE